MSEDSEKKSYGSWIGEQDKHAPGPGYALTVELELFSSEAKFSGWKSDLQRARKACRGPGNNILKINLEVALAELARAGLIDQASNPAQGFNTTADARKHMAAAARENVELITNRLTDVFVGRGPDLAAIDEFVEHRMAGGDQGLMVITAPPGFGKSALAAHWCSRSVQNRRIASHFCAASYGADTTAPENIFANLHHQVAEILREPIDQSRSFDALAALLGESPPEGEELVVWLDGIDEASNKIECFLPKNLGERVCVIISARADDGATPAYLAPWLTEGMATSHRPMRRSLGKLDPSEVEQITHDLFAKAGLAPPTDLASKIFNASDGGYALISRKMVEGAIKATEAGKETASNEIPESISHYIKDELERLESLEQWTGLESLFAFLTIAREAVSVDDLPSLIGTRISPRALPPSLMRWLSFVEAPSRDRPALISFAHPLLAEVFGTALGYKRNRAVKKLCQELMAKPRSEWSRYTWQHLPHHLLEADRQEDAISLLSEFDFVNQRFFMLGATVTAQQMVSDFRSWWQKCPLRFDQYPTNDHLLKLQFWQDYCFILTILASKGAEDVWRQLMHDVGLCDRPVHASLLSPQPSVLELGSRAFPYVDGLSVFPNYEGFVSWDENGALISWESPNRQRVILSDHGVRGAVAGNDGVLFWDANDALHIVSRDGVTPPQFVGHERGVTGALRLDHAPHFITWGYDGTLGLWTESGDQLRRVNAHIGPVRGVSVIPEQRGFLSWGKDGILKIWDDVWGAGPIVHDDCKTIGATATDSSSFLSWDDENKLHLWRTDGTKVATCSGHEGAIKSALAIPNGGGFVTSSMDRTVRIWGMDGNPYKVIKGVWENVALHWSGIGFISWGFDQTISLWSFSGCLLNVWASPGGFVRLVQPYDDSYLLAFDGYIGAAKLA